MEKYVSGSGSGLEWGRSMLSGRAGTCGQGQFREAKLVRMPAGLAGLRVEVRQFEAERCCEVRVMRVRRLGFVELVRMVEEMDLGMVNVQIDESVRAGHVMLVGV